MLGDRYGVVRCRKDASAIGSALCIAGKIVTVIPFMVLAALMMVIGVGLGILAGVIDAAWGNE